MKKYWHELPLDERVKAMETLTVGQVMRQYNQPDWCDYPNALEGSMGCWSLVSKHIIICNEYCKTCECYKHKTKTTYEQTPKT